MMYYGLCVVVYDVLWSVCMMCNGLCVECVYDVLWSVCFVYDVLWSACGEYDVLWSVCGVCV